MSRRTKQAATSHRTRRADRQQPAPAHPTVVSDNPIFFCGDGCTDADDALRALALDDAPAAVGKPLPLPLPPSRSNLPAGSRADSTLVMSKHGSGWVLRREPRDDPFLAAYVACTKSGGGGKVDAEPAKRPQRKKKNIGAGTVVQGCGIWSGWAAGAKYAGAMSCKYGSDAVAVQGDGRPSAAAVMVQASPVPSLHLSRQLVVIPARKRGLVLARGRAQD